MKKLCLLGVACVLLPFSAQAISFDYGENLFLDQAIEDDFYGAGWTVDLAQTVSGDVVIAGGTVRIDQDIQQDLIVFGGQVQINGNIGDDLKIFGGEVELNGKVGDDVIGAGGNLTITEKAEVGGSINLAGFFTDFRGRANENFTFRGGTLLFSGEVAGLANLNAGVLQFSDTAKIGSDLNYTTGQEQAGLERYVGGKISYKAPQVVEPVKTNTFSNINFWAIFSSILNLLLVALLIYAVSPALLLKPAEMLTQSPARSFIFGMEVLIITPFAILLLFLLTWFIPFAFLLTALWFIVLYLGRVFVALAFGLLVLPIKNLKKNPSQIFLPYLLGLAIYEVLVNIPLFGFLIWLLAMVFGAGALVGAKIEFFRNLTKKKII